MVIMFLSSGAAAILFSLEIGYVVGNHWALFVGVIFFTTLLADTSPAGFLDIVVSFVFMPHIRTSTDRFESIAFFDRFRVVEDFIPFMGATTHAVLFGLYLGL
jgi:hypothetical protein